MSTFSQEREEVVNDIMEELAADDWHRGPIGCVEKAVIEHPGYTEDILEAVHSTYAASAVSRALARRDIDMSDYTILRHRAKKCRCPEEYHRG